MEMETRWGAEGISYLVCATQRSGSTLLCELLRATDVAGVPDEYFERLRETGTPRQPRQYFEDPSVQDIAERLTSTCFVGPTSPTSLRSATSPRN